MIRLQTNPLVEEVNFGTIDLRDSEVKRRFLEAPGKYLPFKVDNLDFSSAQPIVGRCTMVDRDPETREDIEVTYKVSFSGRSKGSKFKLSALSEWYDLAPAYVNEDAMAASRTITFSNDTVQMGRQFSDANFSAAVFAMITKMAMKMMKDEAPKGPAGQTGILNFFPVGGGRGGNARSRVYAIVGLRLAREGFGQFVNPQKTQFLLKPFFDLLLANNIISHRGSQS